jgi:hypothetical protein
MPKTFEETLASLSGEERKLFDSTLAKHPELKEGWLRQDDYSRHLNEFKAKEKDFEAAKSRKEELEAWAEKNVPIYDSLVEKGIIGDDGEELWSKQKTELEAKLAEAAKAAVGGHDMKPEEVEAKVREIIKAAGGASKEEYEALVQAESKKIAEQTFKEQWTARETDFNTKTIPMVAGFSAAVTTVAMHYEKETGKPFDKEKRDELFKLMGDKGKFDALEVETDFLAPVRAEKEREQKIEEEVRKRVHAQRGETGSGEDYIPQPDAPKGALKMMLDRSKEQEGDIASLVGEAAKKAASDLRTEGKF